MHVAIQANGFELSKSLHKHIEQRLLSSFQFTERRVRKIIVRLFNGTTSRKKFIKSCRVQTVVNGLPQVITEHHGKNFYVAADTAIQRANRSVSRRIRKMREYRRNIIDTPIENLA